MLVTLFKELRDIKKTYFIMKVLAQNPELGINVFKYEDLIRENLDKSDVDIASLVLLTHREAQASLFSRVENRWYNRSAYRGNDNAIPEIRA